MILLSLSCLATVYMYCTVLSFFWYLGASCRTRVTKALICTVQNIVKGCGGLAN